MGSLLLERDRSGGSAQGRYAPAGAGRLWRSWRRPGGPVVGDGRSGRRNGAGGRTEEHWWTQTGRRRLVGQGGVRPGGVVVVEPGAERGGAFVRGRKGARIGPLAQAGLDEALGLAVLPSPGLQFVGTLEGS
jgi:hypothetical protein